MSMTMDTISNGARFVYGGIHSLYEQHSRRDEFRRLQADTTVASSIAELRSVKAFVSARLIELRAETVSHAGSATICYDQGNHDDALAHYRLKLLYDAQITHTQRTAAAIEAHIISLEAQAIHRKVLRALKCGVDAHSLDDLDCAEDDAEIAVDTLSESHATSLRIMEVLSSAPALDTGATNTAMVEWMGRAMPGGAPHTEIPADHFGAPPDAFPRPKLCFSPDAATGASSFPSVASLPAQKKLVAAS
jgi:hypothetical protein